MKKIIFFIFLLFILQYRCDIFNTPFANNAVFDDYFNNLQIYSSWASDQNGPLLSTLQYGSGQQLFFGCLSASYLTNGFLSIIAQAPFNYSLSIASNSTVNSPNGIPFFKTNTSFGFNGNTSYTNCTSVSGSNILCWNINSTTGAFAPGGYCGAEGYQQQPSVIFIIFSAPCLNATVGSPCKIPGVNLCAANATCQSNYLCNGTAVFNQPPVPLPNSCWFAGECDISTGIFPILNSSSTTSCSNGHSCVVNENCDGLQNCLGGNLNCSRNGNGCLGQPSCNATTSWNCEFETATRDGLPCNFVGGFACRDTDTCGGGTCNEGDPRPLPIPDPACTFGNITCDNSTGQYIVYNMTDGTPCNGTNKCQIGSCLSSKCANFVNLNSTLGVISNCLQPACDPLTGAWFTVGVNNPGITCQYPDVLNQDFCVIGVCNSNNTCINGGTYICPLGNNPCVVYSCNTTFGLLNRCQPSVVPNIPCNLNSCNKNGTCDNTGFCANTTLETCDNIKNYNPQCSTKVCDSMVGCFLLNFASNVTCNDPCYINGTASCGFGFCGNGVTSPACSFFSRGIRPEVFFPLLL